MTLGEKLKQLRKSKKMSQSDVSEAIPTSFSTYRRWETDEYSPDLQMLSRLSQVLDTTVAYLSGETDEPDRNAAKNALRALRQEISSNVRPVETVKVPLVGGLVKACCGDGNSYASDVEWEITGSINIPYADLLAYSWQAVDGFYTIRVEGNSMEPRIHDDDIILFAQIPISNGNFALVRYDGRLIVRAIWDDKHGHYRLHALNPDYEDIMVDGNDAAHEFMILGKVLRGITMNNLADGVM